MSRFVSFSLEFDAFTVRMEMSFPCLSESSIVVCFRLLVASMQSICLERLGGEHKVDPRLQETTFIQHTFGGRLRSKVFIAISLCLTSILSYLTNIVVVLHFTFP